MVGMTALADHNKKGSVMFEVACDLSASRFEKTKSSSLEIIPQGLVMTKDLAIFTNAFAV